MGAGTNGGLNPDYPASSPYAVGCGGTFITLNNNATEIAWSLSGGGISTMYKMPEYQASS